MTTLQAPSGERGEEEKRGGREDEDEGKEEEAQVGLEGKVIF